MRLVGRKSGNPATNRVLILTKLIAKSLIQIAFFQGPSNVVPRKKSKEHIKHKRPGTIPQRNARPLRESGQRHRIANKSIWSVDDELSRTIDWQRCALPHAGDDPSTPQSNATCKCEDHNCDNFQLRQMLLWRFNSESIDKPKYCLRQEVQKSTPKDNDLKSRLDHVPACRCQTRDSEK